MTNAARSIHEVEADLTATRQHLESELSTLAAEFEAASLRVAEGFTDAAKKVPDLKRKMTEIRDELATLDAAGRGLHKRREEANKAARVQKVQDARAALPGAIKEVEGAFDAVVAAIAALGIAWGELERATNSANGLAWEIHRPSSRPDSVEIVNRIRLDDLANLAGGLLWNATRENITPASIRFTNTLAGNDEIVERTRYTASKLESGADLYVARSIKAING